MTFRVGYTAGWFSSASVPTVGRLEDELVGFRGGHNGGHASMSCPATTRSVREKTKMNRIAEELDATLNELDPVRAKSLITLVRRAIEQVQRIEQVAESGWPNGYFEQTAGSFANEPLERFPQGEPAARDTW